MRALCYISIPYWRFYNFTARKAHYQSLSIAFLLSAFFFASLYLRLRNVLLLKRLLPLDSPRVSIRSPKWVLEFREFLGSNKYVLTLQTCRRYEQARTEGKGNLEMALTKPSSFPSHSSPSPSSSSLSFSGFPGVSTPSPLL